MPQDAFTLRYIIKELNELFTGGKISRINQPEKDLLSFLIYTRKGTLKLDTELSAKYCRVSTGENTETPNPKAAPNFCMLLRKHLQNAEITRVEQLGFERVLYFDFKCFSEFEITEMRLYLEIMGKYSNAILVKDGIIVGALKTASLETGARRVTLSGAKYMPPEKQDKADPTVMSGLREAFKNKTGEAVKFIADNIAGIAYTTACDAVELYGEDITAEQLYDYINSDEYTPCVTYLDGAPNDFKARACKGSKRYKSILEAQAAFYTDAVGKKKFADAKRRLLSAVSSAEKKCEKRLAQTLDKLAECEKSEDIKIKGELITANIYAVERGMTRFEAVNYYDENGGSIVIDLDPRLTPAQNAQKYYKRYAKMKRTLQVLSGQREESEAKLDYFKSISVNLNLAENMHDLKETEDELISLSLISSPANAGEKRGANKSGKKNGKQKPKGGKKDEAPSPYRTYIFDGYTVVCGRNNVQNDRLTRGLAANDVWLHTKTFHSSHVGILSDGREPTDAVVKYAAEICAYYSDARGKDKVAVDYTQKKYVKKPNGANLGFAVYTDYKTIIVAPHAHSEDRRDE